MRISLIIPAYNEEARIGACLDSVAPLSQEFCEVIVVNNASTDRTVEIASSYPFVTVVTESKKGLLHARRCGFENTKGEVLAYIDADSRIYEAWPRRLKQVLEENPQVVSLSGPARYYDANAWQKVVLGTTWRVAAPLIYRMTGYMIFGAAFAVRRTALAAIGGFDPSIEFYGEDTDLAKRLSSQGKVLFRMNFYILTSARRFIDEGFLRTTLVYGLNFIWPALLGRPFSRSHKDIRTTP